MSANLAQQVPPQPCVMRTVYGFQKRISKAGGRTPSVDIPRQQCFQGDPVTDHSTDGGRETIAWITRDSRVPPGLTTRSWLGNIGLAAVL